MNSSSFFAARGCAGFWKRLLPLLLVAVPWSAAGATNRVESLTLDQALALAEAQHPDLAESRALSEAAAGRAEQAGSFPNPELIGRMESAPFRGNTLGQAEYLGGVVQPIPLSRRLARAQDAERLDQQRLNSGVEVKRRELRRRVHGAFATALYQERAMQTQTDNLKASEQAVSLTKLRVELGDAIPEDLARVELEALRAEVAARRSRWLRDQAFNALGGAIGSSGLTVGSVDGDLEAAFEVPALETLTASLDANPALTAASADVAAREARVALARAERVPDIRVEALYRRIESERQDSFDVGFSLPLPLFDRGQGRVRAARAELEAAEARSRATALDLSQRLRQAHLALSAALSNVRILKDKVLPRVATVRDALEARYAAGDAGLAEVLQVRRESSAAQLDYLEALREVMLAWGELQAFR